MRTHLGEILFCAANLVPAIGTSGVAGRCSMNRAGFTGCKARSYIPSAHRTGRNVGPDIPLLENDDAGMPPRSLYSSHGTFFEAPRHMMSGNPALFRAIQESQRAPKWNAEAERVKLRRYALHPYVVLEGDKFGKRFEGRGSPMEQDGFHALSINRTENCDNIRRKGTFDSCRLLKACIARFVPLF